MSPFRRLLGQAAIGFWLYTLIHLAAIGVMQAGFQVQWAVKVLLRPLWTL